MNDAVLNALERAVAAAPADIPLRLHLAEQLVAAGRPDDAVGHCATALAQDPANQQARELMARALAPPAAAPPAATPIPPAAAPPAATPIPPAAAPPAATPIPGAPPVPGSPPIPGAPPVPGAPPIPGAPSGGGFDWGRAEEQVGDIAGPMFVGDGQEAPPPAQPAWDVESSTVTLADVGGMAEVKERLEMSFLAPMRNPELRRLYGKSLRGGLLLYGPPGCGKTFIARAVAGEIGASFISVGLSDILDMWIGSSERNVHELFQLARTKAPVVLFLDEIDALGQKRSQTHHTAMRGTVNQLLSELDGVDSSNDGVFVLAATNQPWDVDPALRRPGRLDRTVLVLPPDAQAREAVLRSHLAHRPVERIDLRALTARTDGFSGADLAHLAESAAEFAMMDGIRSGTVRMIGMPDFERALREVRSSIGPWFEVARNVVSFADPDGSYADLRAYMKKTRRL